MKHVLIYFRNVHKLTQESKEMSEKFIMMGKKCNWGGL